MIVITEQAARRLVSPSDAMEAVEFAFKEVAGLRVLNFPIVRERLAPIPDIYGIKSGVATEAQILGLKIGGYWSGNVHRKLTNHQSTTVLSDPCTGRPLALVASNYLTGLRTAAASALAINHLARTDVSTLGMIGTGAQSLFHLQLACMVRPFKRILLNSLHSEHADDLLAWAARHMNIEAKFESAEVVAHHADVLITLTPSCTPIVEHTWVRPGTHICAMGADTTGKQELATAIMADARVYVDDWKQASTVGESQAAVRAGLLDEAGIAGTLCDVVAGTIPGRQCAQEITVFDSTGIAIQDLAIAHHAYQAAKSRAGDGVHDIDLLT